MKSEVRKAFEEFYGKKPSQDTYTPAGECSDLDHWVHDKAVFERGVKWARRGK